MIMMNKQWMIMLPNAYLSVQATQDWSFQSFTAFA